MFRILHSFLLLSILIGCGGGEKSPSFQNTIPSYDGKTIDTIVISSANQSIPVNFSSEVRAIAYFSDDTSMDFSTQVAWQSNNENIATFDVENWLTAKQSGDTSIYAAYNGLKSNSLSIETNNETLTSIQLTPSDINVPSTGKFTYKVMGTFSDGRTLDVTPDISWDIPGQIAEPNELNRRDPINTRAESPVVVDRFGRVSTSGEGELNIQAQVNDIRSNVSAVAVKEIELIEMQIIPGVAEIAAGTFMQYQVNGFFDDNSTFQLTDQVSWSSSDENLASISDSGLLRGISPGRTTISATWNNFTASVPVIILDKQLVVIQVTPENETLAVQSEEKFHAVGIFSDDSAVDITDFVSWKSSKPEVASVTLNGLITGISQGNTQISASLNGISSYANLSVSEIALESIQITPGMKEMWRKNQAEFQATGFYSDGSSHNITKTVSWHSQDKDKITIIDGIAVAQTNGETEVTAQKFGVRSNRAKITINSGELESIHVTPAQLELPINSLGQLHANGHYSDNLNHDITPTAAWRSSAPNIATVSANGHIKGISAGTAEIRAYKKGIVSHAVTVTVLEATLESIQITPAQKNVSVRVQDKYHAIGYYSNGINHDITELVTWHSSNKDVARILFDGSFVGLSAGTSNIYASKGNIDSNQSVLTVDDNELVKIQITPGSTELSTGKTKTFSAKGYYSDGENYDISETVSWISSEPQIATISSRGVVTAHSIGVTQMIAIKNGVRSEEWEISVSDGRLTSIQVSPGIETLTVGSQKQFEAKGKYSDNTSHEMTEESSWKSSDPDTASITPDGVVHARAPGEVEIVARTKNTVSNQAKLTIITGELSEIHLNQNALNLPLGSTYQLNANGLYTSGYHQDITQDATWRSTNPDDGSISNLVTISDSGLVTAVALGDAEISVSMDGISQSIPITVSRGTLESITLNYSQARLIPGKSSQLTAQAHFDTQLNVDNADFFNWRSTDTGVARVTAQGKVIAIGAGNADIIASKGDIDSEAFSVEVLAVTLQEIVVSPAGRIMSKDSYHQFRASGRYLDSNGDNLWTGVTEIVNWRSSDTQKATISTTGEVHTLSTLGDTSISASIGLINSNAATLSVSNAQLSSIQLAIKSTSNDLSIGNHRILYAEGTFDDGTVENIDNKVLWKSNDKLTVEKNNYFGYFATGTSAGTGIVYISLNDMNAQFTINVLPSGSYSCATPTITVDIDGVSRTFHCPKEISEVNNEESYRMQTGGWNYPALMKVAVYKQQDISNICSSRGLQHVSQNQFKQLATALGYSHIDLKLYMVLDYGWPMDRWLLTSDPWQNGLMGISRVDLNQKKQILPNDLAMAYCVDW